MRLNKLKIQIPRPRKYGMACAGWVGWLIAGADVLAMPRVPHWSAAPVKVALASAGVWKASPQQEYLHSFGQVQDVL